MHPKPKNLIPLINKSTPLHGLVNSAAIFESLSLETTSAEDWEKHLAINLTAPFLLSQAFAKQAPQKARIVNILDWRALRPGADHFPYTISKAALAASNKVLRRGAGTESDRQWLGDGRHPAPFRRAMASPNRTSSTMSRRGRWAEEDEVAEALLFLLTCPAYITGEIMYLDGGRHLV